MELKDLPPKVTLRTFLRTVLWKAFSSAYPEAIIDLQEIEVSLATQEQFGDYQCSTPMKITKKLHQGPREIAAKVLQHLESNLFSTVEVAGPGFINMTLKPSFLLRCLAQCHDDRVGIPRVINPQKMIVEFSSPNIAKEMHVGHLRSTIIGDTIARLFEFLGHQVIRLNHIGDWGTAFGMLIAYIKKHHPNGVQQETTDITLLMKWYKAAKQEFDADEAFKQQAREAVVALQSGDPTALHIWQVICTISRKAFQEIYNLLDIRLMERGESYYNPYLPRIVSDLESKGLVQISDGAKCIFHEGFPIPLMIQKGDGGYNYDTTDMAALWQRIVEEKAERIIVLTDIGQKLHFDLVRATAEKAGYLDAHLRFDHVTFGLVSGVDGKKYKTRSGETEKLIHLLEQAILQAKEKLAEKRPDLDEKTQEESARILGIDAVKYGDLSTQRTQDYMFSYERILRFEGNTAPFLLYAYVRALNIQRKAGSKGSLTALTLEHPTERNLAVGLLRFGDTLESYAEELLPHLLAEYLYQLACQFNLFFRDCPVIGSGQEMGRLALCDLTIKTLRLGLNILGLKTLDRM